MTVTCFDGQTCVDPCHGNRDHSQICSVRPAVIEIRLKCGSCSRTEWCGITNENCDELGMVPTLVDIPDGWLVEIGETALVESHTVQCPDHRRLS